MKQILIVDDEVLLPKVMASAFKDPDREIHLSNSAELAFDMVSQTDYNLVLTDYSMSPGKNGLWLLEQIKVIKPDIIRCMMSGLNDDFLTDDKELIDYTFRKPFNMRVDLDIFDNLLKRGRDYVKEIN